MRAGSEPIAAAIALALGLGVAGAPTVARAQPSAAAAATLQFDKGRALLKEKKYAEACAAFEQSQKLDPQLGTLYNLGVCYAALGKTASAWSAYREVGQRDQNPNRKKEANRRAKELEKRLPKLVVTIATAPPGLKVTMNGVDVTALLGADSPLDPAEYKLRATAPGFAPWESTVKIPDEGKTTKLAIELARPGAKEPPRPRPPVTPAPVTPAPVTPAPVAPAPPVADPARPPGGDGDGGEARALEPSPPPPPEGAPKTRKRIALAVGIGGVAALGAGLVVGGMARSKWNEAAALCGDDHLCDDPATLDRGNALVDAARMRANLSTGLVIGGVALLGAGAVLYLTAPSGKPEGGVARSLRVAPQLGPGHAGLVLGGRFP